MPYIPCLPYIPNIPYFPNMPYQTDHTHHTYPTYQITPPPHHRGGGGQYHTPTTPQRGEGDSTTPPPHHRGGRGGGQCHHTTGGEGEDLIWGHIWDPCHGGGRGWQGIIGIVRLWFFKIHGNKNEPPYALIIPKHRGFTTQVLYKNKIAKEFVKASYFFLNSGRI